MSVYGTLNNVPGDQITVRSGGTVGVTPQFESEAILVGGMDTANGTATPGNVSNEIATSSDASDLFGQNSELYEASVVAKQNGVADLYAVPVTETQTTESFTASQDFTLANAPSFDPNVQYEHSVTITDTQQSVDLDVTIVYDSPTTPSGSNEANFNPVTGEVATDASSDYDVTHTYGDYTSALGTAVGENPRIIGLLNENTSVVNDAITDVTNAAQDFNFMHVVAGVEPDVDVGNYTDTIDERRVSLLAPSRGYIDDTQSTQLRTVAGVAGRYAGNALGNTATYEAIGGYTGLYENFDNSQASDLIDEQVAPIQMRGASTLLKDMTTSTDPRFERVYASEITDEVTELSHLISQEFIGELNTQTQRRSLRKSHEASYKVLAQQTPPLLDAYDVDVSEDSANADEVDVNIGVDIVDVIDNVDVTVTVGDIIQNGGAN